MPVLSLNGLWHSSLREGWAGEVQPPRWVGSQTYNPPIRGAAMISSNDFRTGSTIELDGQVWRVIEFLHVKPGKGSAFVRTKLKAVKSGNVVERTFRAGETVPQAQLEKATLQHTYMEGEDYVFMDMGSYEETRLKAEEIGAQRKYLKEGMEVTVLTYNNKPLEVELPNSVILEISQTDPGVKGDTATGGTKPAILETGAQVMVPLFISIGDKIKVDTRTDSYLGRES
jgi:elongation factor P